MSAKTMSAQYLALTMGNAINTIKKNEFDHSNYISKDEANRLAQQVKMDMLVKMDDQYNDLTNQIEALHEELEEVRGLAKKKVSQPRAPKKQSEKKNSGGANHNLQADLQSNGKLAPFREGGCKCRTWGDRMGTQCSNVAKEDGMCKMHFNKVEKQGSWQLGFYNEPRPEKWGKGHDGSEIHFPNHEKEGGKIGWRMDEETFKVAFARDICAECPPEEEEDTLPMPETPREEVVEDVLVEEPPKQEEPVCIICPTTGTECEPLGDINLCYSCADGTKSCGQFYFPVNGAGVSTGRCEPLCETCWQAEQEEEDEFYDEE